ncbi:MAG: KEOPS complex kinase/ATPase Bud32 [Nanoarchaeota archaeon]
MQKRIISRGAEAVLYKEGDFLVKDRIKKNYRISEIDDKLRLFRTRREAKIMQKVDFAPKIINVDERNMIIKMDFIEGETLKNIFDKIGSNKRDKICLKIGENIAKLHEHNIIHGDLTTNNMILNENLYFVDFGLSFISDKIEDKAVDLHLLRQALEGRHHEHAEKSFGKVLEGYKKYSRHDEVLERLEKVEKRGRYKRRKKK